MIDLLFGSVFSNCFHFIRAMSCCRTCEIAPNASQVDIAARLWSIKNPKIVQFILRSAREDGEPMSKYS